MIKRYVSDYRLTESSMGAWILYCEHDRALRKLQAKIEALEAEIEKLENPGWKGFIKFAKQWLTTNYPPDIFDGSGGYAGPLFVVTLRNAIETLEAGK